MFDPHVHPGDRGGGMSNAEFPLEVLFVFDTFFSNEHRSADLRVYFNT